MLDSIKAIGYYSDLAHNDQKKLLSDLAASELSDVDVDRVLISIAIGGQWACLKAVLRYPSIRRRLGAVLPQMQDQASSRQESLDFAASLPRRLDADSSRVALDFSLQTQSWDLAKEMIDRGAFLTIDRFRLVCDRYSQHADGFDRRIIISMMTREMVDWRKALGFHPLDSWREVLARGVATDEAYLYLCASCLMNSRQKKLFISEVTSKHNFLMAIQHMNLTGKWQAAIPGAYRDIAIASQLGL